MQTSITEVALKSRGNCHSVSHNLARDKKAPSRCTSVQVPVEDINIEVLMRLECVF